MSEFISSNIPPNGFGVPLLHKSIAFYKLFHEYLKFFPRQEKYSLGQKIENSIIEIIEMIFKAAYAERSEKIGILKELDKKLDLLKILIRLAGAIKALDNKKYLALQEKIQELGRMIGGWIKSMPNPQKDI